MSDQPTISLEELKHALSEFDVSAYWDAKRLRKERPWVRDIIAVLYPRQNGIRMAELVDSLLDMRKETLSTPKELKNTVQSCLNRHTAQSTVFIKKGSGPEDDLFYSPKGKRSGTWAVHREKALAWLQRKSLPST